MNYFFSTKDSSVLNDIMMLLVRIFIGIAMIFLHGLPKLENLLSGEPIKFYSFLSLSAETTLIIATIIEIVGALFIIIGLFTRASSLILMLMMIIAAFGYHYSDPFSLRENSLLYLSIFTLIFAFGSRKYSIDNMLTKRRESKW